MKHPLIITCAITGAETTKDKQPALPVTPEEQGVASLEAMKAGASVIHLHVRDSHGRPSQNIEDFRLSINEIRKQCGPEIIIQISTGGAVGESIENRASPLSLKPEMASLNIGSLNFGDNVFINAPKDVESMAWEIHKNQIIPELEIYEVGHLESAYTLLKKGVVKLPFHIQFVLGVPGGMSGEIDNFNHLVKYFESKKTPDCSWGVAGIGRYQLPMAIAAIERGGQVRVGFEDNIFYSKGVLATSNAQLVERVAGLAREAGRTVATPAQARQIYGIK
ncbi:MAG: 3-keto-5-aminohexanoate cleavage protein [Xanthomonadaceae bacterium]|nr:3-keto-5-aminohexanoate cleavage protein [Xanthomonadaceae bacterium]